MRIFVVAPDYTHQSGGVEALHYLMYLLQRAGYEVITTAKVFNPRYDLKPAYRSLPVKSDDMIIAPEVNFLDSIYHLELPVLRWVLYFVGVHDGPAEYPECEIVYHYQKNFKETAVKAAFNRKSREFFLPHLLKEDFELKDEIVRGEGDLYFVHKGTNMKTHPRSAVEINRENTATRQQYLRLLREYKTLYCYDRNTFLLVEAHVSGMNVLQWDYDNNRWETFVLCCDEFRNYRRDTRAAKRLINDFKFQVAINRIKRKYRAIKSLLKRHTR